MSRLNEIDGLRALAVIAVIIYHYEKSLAPLGYLGVDIFFAISGYVITKSIIDGMDANEFTFNDFFLRRAKRLLPALALVVVTTLLLASMLLPGKGTFASGAAAFFGLSNIWFWHSGFDYFSVSTEWNPLTHTWSLGVEEQFYAIFPLLLAALFKRQRLLVLAICAIGLVSLFSYFSFWHQNRIAAFYLSPMRIWELVAGSVVFLVHRDRGHPRMDGATQGLKHIAIAVMIYTIFSPHLSEVTATALVVASTCLLLHLVEKSDRGNVLLTNAVSQYIGRISYSLYLWHWPVIVFLKLTIPSNWILPSYVLVTATLSVVTFHLIERPLRHRPWRGVHDRFTRTFIGYSIFALTAIGALFVARPTLYIGETKRQEVQFLRSSPCHIPGANGLNLCLNRTDNDRRTIWLLGDSHAGNFSIGLSMAADQLSAEFRTLTGRSLFNSLSDSCRSKTDCPEGGHHELTRRLAEVTKRGDIVMISFARDRFSPDNHSIDTFGMNLSVFANSLQSLGLHVVFIEDIPKVCGDDGEYLRSAFQPSLCRASSEDSKRSRAVLSQIYRNVTQNVEAQIIDPHDLLCQQNLEQSANCSNYLNSRLIYLDASPHLTEQASRDLSGFFIEALRDVPQL